MVTGESTPSGGGRLCGSSNIVGYPRLPGLWKSSPSTYSWWFRNPARKPVELRSLPHDLQGFYTFQVVVWDFFHQHIMNICWSTKGIVAWFNGSVLNYYAVSTWASFLLKITYSSFCRWNSPLKSLGGLRVNNMFIFMKGARSIFMKSTGFPVFRQGPQRYQFGIEDFWWSLFSYHRRVADLFL